MKLWVVTTGDGSDGSELAFHAICTTGARAEEIKKSYQYSDANVEEWETDNMPEGFGWTKPE